MSSSPALPTSAPASSRRGSKLLVAPVVAGAVTLTGFTGAAQAAPVQAAPLPAAPLPAAPVQAAPVQAAPNAALAAAPRLYLKYGSRGSVVKRVQSKLRVRPVSGWYGPRTRAAVKRFQRSKRLAATGAIDARTWRALGLGALPGSRPSASARGYRYNLGSVRAHVARAAYEVGPRFGIRNVGGWRSWGADRSGHPSGLALDFMVTGSRGTAVANYVIANAKRLRVYYVIWNRRIWMPSRGWRSYGGSSPHTDHVHVSFNR